MAGLYAPLPTLRRRPRGRLRTDRGRRGLLLLHRSGLSPHTPCQSPGALTRVAACTLARSPIRDPLPEGFRHFVTSMPAPVASGWSGCRVGLAPTGKAPPFHGARGKGTFPAARYTESDPLRTWTVTRIGESGRSVAARQGHASEAIAVRGGKCAEALGKVWCGWHQRESRHFQSIDCRPAHLCSGVALTSISVTKHELASSRRIA